MATTFGGSRLANLREKRTSGEQANSFKESNLNLDLFANEPSAYEPSSSFHNSRTNTRLLKGRIDRSPFEKEENTEFKVGNENLISQKNDQYISKPKFAVSQQQSSQLKLVLNDNPPKNQQRRASTENAMKTTQKRILISKEPEKEKEEVKSTETEIKKVSRNEISQLPIANPDSYIEKPIIKEEQIQESKDQVGQNDLIQCPEGCGRKFNKKALEKHAKACKLVFMSKRKQFNSEAKRITTKEQANIVKQSKLKEKKDVVGKAKFEKTTDNWKAASQDFRAALKAIKKEQIDETDQNNDGERQEQMKIIPCKFCQKPFADVFLEKHQEACGKKKQGEKKKTMPKKK